MGAFIRGIDVEHISQNDTMQALAKLAVHFRDSKATAECRLDPEQACPAPRPAELCRWGPTKFCAARLKLAAVESLAYDAEVAKREKVERAELIGLPKYLWTMLGIDRHADGLKETEAVRYARHAAGSSRMRLVVLMGNDGTGKATAAALWCWLVGGWFYRATNLRWFTRGGWYRDSGDNRLLSSPAVAIVGLDKPWASKDGSHKHSLIHTCHERLDAGKLTLITSNLSQSDLEATLGPSLCASIRRWNGMAKISEQADGQQQESAVY